MRSDCLKSLPSPAFIATLALLVINDVALKPVLRNALTGKLSDFAGLFALTLFVVTLWPRHRRLAAWAITAAFAFWKTTYAEPLIELLNAVSPVAFGRTVDLTDFVALPMIPLAAWAAPRVAPWPLPKVLQAALVVVALVAFTATSRARYAARSTMDVTQQAAVDEPVLQSLFDEIADARGLRCQVCVPLSEGRVYRPRGESNVHVLIVKLDRQTLDVMTSGYDRERGVRVLARRIRSEIEKRYPSMTVIDSSAGPLFAVEGKTTIFVVRDLSESDAEPSRATMSSILEEVARYRGLAGDPSALRYHTGDGVEPEYSTLQVVAVLDEAGMLLVKVISRSADGADALHSAVSEQLAARLDAEFGPERVTRHISWTPLELVY